MIPTALMTLLLSFAMGWMPNTGLSSGEFPGTGHMAASSQTKPAPPEPDPAGFDLGDYAPTTTNAATAGTQEESDIGAGIDPNG